MSDTGTPSNGKGAQDFLRTAQFNTPSMQDTPISTAADVLNPAAFDPVRLHPLSGITDKLEYLTLDDDKTNEIPGATTALPNRGWGDDLCYGTGSTYLSGMLLSYLLAWKFE